MDDEDLLNELDEIEAQELEAKMVDVELLGFFHEGYRLHVRRRTSLLVEWWPSRECLPDPSSQWQSPLGLSGMVRVWGEPFRFG